MNKEIPLFTHTAGVYGVVHRYDEELVNLEWYVVNTITWEEIAVCKSQEEAVSVADEAALYSDTSPETFKEKLIKSRNSQIVKYKDYTVAIRKTADKKSYRFDVWLGSVNLVTIIVNNNQLMKAADEFLSKVEEKLG